MYNYSFFSYFISTIFIGHIFAINSNNFVNFANLNFKIFFFFDFFKNLKLKYSIKLSQ
jgi:hypothetical protein